VYIILSMDDGRNPYAVLKLPRTCTDDDIRKAFLELAKERHPDKSSSLNATEQFQELIAAYDVLTDPVKRRELDRKTTKRRSASAFDPYDGDDPTPPSSPQEGPTRRFIVQDSPVSKGWKKPAWWVHSDDEEDFQTQVNFEQQEMERMEESRKRWREGQERARKIQRVKEAHAVEETKALVKCRLRRPVSREYLETLFSDYGAKCIEHGDEECVLLVSTEGRAMHLAMSFYNKDLTLPMYKYIRLMRAPYKRHPPQPSLLLVVTKKSVEMIESDRAEP